MQNLKLDSVGLRTYVDAVLPAGDEGVQKPNPELYYRAARRLCVSPQNCVFVGDYQPTDIRGAQAADMTPLYIDVHGRNNCPEGVEEITSLKELLEKY
jgi:putative hydrolase of the HAD superfamily